MPEPLSKRLFWVSQSNKLHSLLQSLQYTQEAGRAGHGGSDQEKVDFRSRPDRLERTQKPAGDDNAAPGLDSRAPRLKGQRWCWGAPEPKSPGGWSWNHSGATRGRGWRANASPHLPPRPPTSPRASCWLKSGKCPGKCSQHFIAHF